MGFSGFGICPRRKVMWSKVLQVLRTRGSINCRPLTHKLPINYQPTISVFESVWLLITVHILNPQPSTITAVPLSPHMQYSPVEKQCSPPIDSLYITTSNHLIPSFSCTSLTNNLRMSSQGHPGSHPDHSRVNPLSSTSISNNTHSSNNPNQ